MPKEPFDVVVQGLLNAGQAAGLDSIDRYAKDSHYKATIDRTARVAVDALKIEPAGEQSADGAPLFRIRALEE